MKSKLIYWSLFKHKDWQIYIASTKIGICYVGSTNKPFEELIKWANKYLPDYSFKEDDKKMEVFNNELLDLIEGKRKDFTIPLDFHGTAFQKEVWDALSKIPYGTTKTYSEIAEVIKRPKAVRAVGTAIGANPLLITIPCHRVVGKNGTLTGYRGGLKMKAKLLKIESQ